MPLTIEDQAILGRLPMVAEARYRLADCGDAIMTRFYLHHRGSVVQSVTVHEQFGEQLRRHAAAAL